MDGTKVNIWEFVNSFFFFLTIFRPNLKASGSKTPASTTLQQVHEDEPMVVHSADGTESSGGSSTDNFRSPLSKSYEVLPNSGHSKEKNLPERDFGPVSSEEEIGIHLGDSGRSHVKAENGISQSEMSSDLRPDVKPEGERLDQFIAPFSVGVDEGDEDILKDVRLLSTGGGSLKKKVQAMKSVIDKQLNKFLAELTQVE